MQPKFKGQCYNCNKYDHKENECRTKSKFEGDYFICHKQGHKSLECRSNIQHNGTRQKKFIGWEYNTWGRCHYYGEYGNIGVNFVETHIRKINTNIRCYVCKKISYLARKCMNRDIENNGEENKGKSKIEEIRNQRN